MEVSDNHAAWRHGTPFTMPVDAAIDNSDGTETVTIGSARPLAANQSKFLRLKVSIVS